MSAKTFLFKTISFLVAFVFLVNTSVYTAPTNHSTLRPPASAVALSNDIAKSVSETTAYLQDESVDSTQMTVFDDFDIAPFNSEEKNAGRAVFEAIEGINVSKYKEKITPLFLTERGYNRAKVIAKLAKSEELFEIFPFLKILADKEMPGHPATWEFFDALDRIIRQDQSGFTRKRKITFKSSGKNLSDLPHIVFRKAPKLQALSERVFNNCSGEKRELLFLMPFLSDVGRCIKPQAHPEIAATYFIRPILEKLGFSPQMVRLGCDLVRKHVDIGTIITTESTPERLFHGWNPKQNDLDMLTILSIADRSYGIRADDLTMSQLESYIDWGTLDFIRSSKTEKWHLRRLGHYLGVSSEEVQNKLEEMARRKFIASKDLALLEKNFGKKIEFIDYGDVVFRYIMSQEDGEETLIKFFIILARVIEGEQKSIQRVNLVKDLQKIASLYDAVQVSDLQDSVEMLEARLDRFGITFNVTSGRFINLAVKPRFLDKVALKNLRRQIEDRWSRLVNGDLARRVEKEGIEVVEATTDLGQERGIIWFPNLIRYKVLDAPGGVVEVSGVEAPKESNYMVQYNVSRGVQIGRGRGGARKKGECFLCPIVKGISESELILCDLEETLGLPYKLVASSRPFFDRHMMILEKGHTGKITLKGMRDLLTIFNELFPDRRGNIGTGSGAAHLHIHVYDVEFPIERQKREWLVKEDELKIGLLESDVHTAGFVVESEDMEFLAERSYQIISELEAQGWLTVVMTAPNQVYVMPQKTKEIGDNYPPILDAFKKNRPEGLRPRYVGPVEAAGIWLCYSRGNIPAMVEMYKTMNLDIYRNIIRDTGVDRSDSTLGMVINKIKSSSAGVNETDITLESFVDNKIPFVELHLTNDCNQRCKWCGYTNKNKKIHLKFEDLDRIAALSPSEILIVGGGEPTLYKDGDKGFNDVIGRLRELLPDTKLRLITNGTIVPPGDWQHKIDEISISLDETTRESYLADKGEDNFDMVWKNIFGEYLEKGPIQHVRVTMVYNSGSLENSILLARKLWMDWKELAEQGRITEAKAENFKFMIFPMADDTSPDNPYEGTKLNEEEKQHWQEKMTTIFEEEPDFAEFIKGHTNIATQPLQKLLTPPAVLCWSALNYILVGADRKYYPCYAMCETCRRNNFGLITQTPQDLRKKRIKRFRNTYKRCKVGCRPGVTFYGLKAFDLFVEQFRDSVLEKWDGKVNRALEEKVEQKGIDRVDKEEDLSKEKGIIWFPHRIRYKILDTTGPPRETTGDPHAPKKVLYLVQYNESRSIKRKQDIKPSKRPKTDQESKVQKCVLCNVPKDSIIADLEEYFGVPYLLSSSSRPFFDKQMHVLAKEHTGGRITYNGFRDLVWILNTAFPGMKGNIGTGNQEAHLHTHVYDIEFPIERLPRKWIAENKDFKIGLLEDELNLAYFVVESEDIELLSQKAYWIMKEFEKQGLLVCVILAPNKVYIIPQKKKTIGKDYPKIFDAFKDEEHRPKDLRPRYIGAVEAAHIFLCYSRGNIQAMEKMYKAMDLDIFKRILSDTGLHKTDSIFKDILSIFKTIAEEDSEFLSFYDPKAADNNLVGGKGKNLHEICELSENTKEPDRVKAKKQNPNTRLNMPEGYIMTTKVFDRVVLKNKNINKKIKELEWLSIQFREARDGDREQIRKQIKDTSKLIREAILKIHIPKEISDKICLLFNSLGGNISVRSSATVEDEKRRAAAGQGKSFRDQRTKKDALNSVKRVWASLFNDGFVIYRIKQGLDIKNAKMAVILQKMVDEIEASGVSMSIDAPTKRPAFRISANRGAGGVVDGQTADRWLVGPDAKYVLEKPEKDGKEALITDKIILQLASLLKYIRDHYRLKKNIQNVDVEFAIDKNGVIHILQCRPETTSTTSEEIRIKVVDESRVPKKLKRLTFDDAIIGSLGATPGRLQVLLPDEKIDERELIKQVKPGTIVVTTRTSCRWNDAMSHIAGILTEKGDSMSHAAIHARELEIPCLTGLSEEVKKLKKYDGKIVVFDSATKTLYLGEVPIIEETRELSLWNKEADIEDKETEKEERTIDDIKDYHNFIQDFEGYWFGRPMIPYSYFQLDYYKRAFGWYRNKLMRLSWPSNRCAKDKSAFAPHIIRIKDRILYIKVDFSTSHTKDFMLSLSLEDFEYLMKRRWRGLERFGRLLSRSRELDASNVERVVDGLVEILGWNSMGYGYREAFKKLYLNPQTRYISKDYLPLMLKMAFPTKKGKNIGSEKDKELCVIAELIRKDKEALDLILRNDIGELRRRKKTIYKRIEALSQKYKYDSEDIRVISDTYGYIEKLKKYLQSPDTDITLEQLGDYCESYVKPRRKPQHILSSIREKDKDLYIVLRGYARKELKLKSERQITANLPKIIDELKEYLQEKRKKAKTIQDALSNYPRLRRILSLGQEETVFRNDAHHLMTRFQRIIAKQMLEAAEKFPHIFKKSKDIFDIGLEELSALIKDKDPSYIKQTFVRNRLIEDAEKELVRQWKTNRYMALKIYKERIDRIIEILGRQLSEASYGKVKRYYKSKIDELQKRIEMLKEIATPKKIINVSFQDPKRLTGGQGWAVLNLCKEQINQGFDVTWVSPCIRDDEPGGHLYFDEKLKVIKIPLSDSDILTLYANDEITQSRREDFGNKFVDYIIEHYNPNEYIIHLHGINTVPGKALELRQKGYNVTSTFHFFLSPRIDAIKAKESFAEQLRKIERQAIAANNKIIVNSTGMAEEVRQLRPDYSGEIFVIRNGVGSEYFEAPKVQFEEPTPVITTYGRISPEKGFDIFVKAAKIITERRRRQNKKGVEFVVFGNSDDSIKARREYLEELNRLAEGFPNIKIIARPEGVRGEEKMRYLEQSSVGVVPSFYEPFGLTIPELMSRGVPVITTLIPGAKDILQRDTVGETPYGFIVDTTPASLANAMEWLLDNPEQAHTMGLNAMERAKHFRWDKVVEETLAIYQRHQGLYRADSTAVPVTDRAIEFDRLTKEILIAA